MIKLTRPLLFCLIAYLFAGCGQSPPAHEPISDPAAARTAAGDSIEQLTLLKNVYRWHDKHQQPADFEVIVQDSFQTGLNYDSFNKSYTALKQTNYFSPSFIDNYKKIADAVDHLLVTAQPKKLNEINFSFQDGDPWTRFQDDAPSFWDSLIISDYKATADSASLKWKIQGNGWSSDPYIVRFSKPAGHWKVAYMEGFDSSLLH